MDEEFYNSLQTDLREQRERNAQLQTALSSSNFQGQQDGNLIQFQLDTLEMLGRIEHFLKGDILSISEDGSERFIKQTDKRLVVLNEYGVGAVMSIVGHYIDKLTILSYYDEMRINEILADLGDNLADFIFCNYEVMGLDTEFKKSRYNLLVINILHSVESAYRRALRGKEREEINSSRIFTQSDIMGRGMGMLNPNSHQKKKPFWKLWG